MNVKKFVVFCTDPVDSAATEVRYSGYDQQYSVMRSLEHLPYSPHYFGAKMYT